MMQPGGSDEKSSGNAADARRAWEPPALTKLAIGTETRSSGKNESDAAPTSSGGQLVEPDGPAAPATKLGFSFEWAFPLSARLEP
jgi:hypothetical protein